MKCMVFFIQCETCHRISAYTTIKEGGVNHCEHGDTVGLKKRVVGKFTYLGTK